MDKEFPGRSKKSDGTIGDAAHATRDSDHNPWIKDGTTGVVTALDITHDPAHGVDSYKLAEILRTNRDPRIKYIISKRRIASPSLQDWAWRPYNGKNAHTQHVHISVKSSKAQYDSIEPWNLEADHLLMRPTLKAGSGGVDVIELQKLLGVRPTGVFDTATTVAVKNYQGLHKLKPDGIVGPLTWASIEGAPVDGD